MTTRTTAKPAAKTAKTAAKPVKTAKPAKTQRKPAAKPEYEPDLHSISSLSRHFKLDRATVRDRLERAEIEPYTIRAKEKLYDFNEVQIPLSQTGLNDAKFRKIDAEAELKALELKKKSGEYASVAEFTEIIQRMMAAFYTKITVTLPTRISAKLHNANSAADVGAILREELNKEWKMLRENYPDYVNARIAANRNTKRNRSGAR